MSAAPRSTLARRAGESAVFRQRRASAGSRILRPRSARAVAAAGSLLVVAGALLALALRPPALPRMAWRRLLRLFIQQGRIEICAGVCDDLLPQFCTQLGCFDFPHRAVV